MDKAVIVAAVLTGQTVRFTDKRTSAINKVPSRAVIRVGALGLSGDEQADLTCHGGVDKAVHHYAFDHYALWAQQQPDHPKLIAPGAFGENISTLGMTEETVCIGDRYHLGSALVEVSQPRQPCWKQARFMNWPTLPRLMTKENKCGWYYRVVATGEVKVDDAIVLEERPYPDWSVARAFSLIMHARRAAPDISSLRALASLEPLAVEWKNNARDLIGY